MDTGWCWVIAYLTVTIIAIGVMLYKGRRSNNGEARREAYKNKLARAIVREIVADFTDRRGLRQEWEQVDYQVQGEIIIAWRNIVRNNIRGL